MLYSCRDISAELEANHLPLILSYLLASIFLLFLKERCMLVANVVWGGGMLVMCDEHAEN